MSTPETGPPCEGCQTPTSVHTGDVRDGADRLTRWAECHDRACGQYGNVQDPDADRGAIWRVTTYYGPDDWQGDPFREHESDLAHEHAANTAAEYMPDDDTRHVSATFGEGPLGPGYYPGAADMYPAVIVERLAGADADPYHDDLDHADALAEHEASTAKLGPVESWADWAKRAAWAMDHAIDALDAIADASPEGDADAEHAADMLRDAMATRPTTEGVRS